MRHRNSGRQLSRNASHRHAMLRNMATSLLRHETIRTTVPKAKELRRVVEPLITLARVDSIAMRRLAYARLRDVGVVEKLFDDLGPRFKARAGGYTRILKMEPRPGDSADMALMQLVDLAPVATEKKEEPKAAKAPKAPKTKGRRRPPSRRRSRKRPRRRRSPRRPPRLTSRREGAPSRSAARPSQRLIVKISAPCADARRTSANASRVIFSGFDVVVATLSSMRTPPKGLSSSTTLQSMCARRASAAGRAQQRIDEVNAGLHGDHHAGFEHAGEAQVGVAGGSLDFVALRHRPSHLRHRVPAGRAGARCHAERTRW